MSRFTQYVCSRLTEQLHIKSWQKYFQIKCPPLTFVTQCEARAVPHIDMDRNLYREFTELLHE